MSGGRWNYDQDRVRDLGESMSRESDPLIAAIGQRLVDLAEVVRNIDWVYNGDSSDWDRARATELLGGPGAELEIVKTRAIEARDQLETVLARAGSRLGPDKICYDIAAMPKEGEFLAERQTTGDWYKVRRFVSQSSAFPLKAGKVIHALTGTMWSPLRWRPLPHDAR